MLAVVALSYEEEAEITNEVCTLFQILMNIDIIFFSFFKAISLNNTLFQKIYKMSHFYDNQWLKIIIKNCEI